MAKATTKKSGRISEYGGKETYSSKSAMKKHEKGESKKVEKREESMARKSMKKR
jgi:hypothetical protein